MYNFNYVWKKFRPTPGEIYFSDYEKKQANKIISEAKTFWEENLSLIHI